MILSHWSTMKMIASIVKSQRSFHPQIQRTEGTEGWRRVEFVKLEKFEWQRSGHVRSKSNFEYTRDIKSTTNGGVD